MNQAIVEQLQRCMAAQELVALYSDPADMSSCSVGYIDALDETMVRIRAVSRYGSDAGYEVRPLHTICRLDVGGFYERKLAFLREQSAHVFHDVSLAAPQDQTALLLATLQDACIQQLIVVLWTADADDSMIGYVESVDHEVVRILSIDDYGREDGHIVLRSSAIVAVDCNTNPAQVIKFLHQHWHAGAQRQTQHRKKSSRA